MNARVVGFLFMSVFALWAVGCSMVSVREPLPMTDRPDARAMLEGTWQLEDGMGELRFQADGIGQFAALEWEDNDFKIVRGEIHLSNAADLGLMSVRTQEDGEWEDRYLVVAYKVVQNGDLVVWTCQAETFADAVESGALAGEVSRGRYGTDVELSSEPTAVLDFISGSNAVQLFNWRDPMVIRRLLHHENKP